MLARRRRRIPCAKGVCLSETRTQSGANIGARRGRAGSEWAVAAASTDMARCAKSPPPPLPVHTAPPLGSALWRRGARNTSATGTGIYGPPAAGTTTRVAVAGQGNAPPPLMCRAWRLRFHKGLGRRRCLGTGLPGLGASEHRGRRGGYMCVVRVFLQGRARRRPRVRILSASPVPAPRRGARWPRCSGQRTGARGAAASTRCHGEEQEPGPAAAAVPAPAASMVARRKGAGVGGLAARVAVSRASPPSPVRCGYDAERKSWAGHQRPRSREAQSCEPRLSALSCSPARGRHPCAVEDGPARCRVPKVGGWAG